MARIAPSILSSDFAALGEAINRIAPQSDLLHVDVMDGHFVPNLSIGPPVVNSLQSHTDLYFDCHLMMTNPGDYLEEFPTAGADGCSVHVELTDTTRLIADMGHLGLDAGLAVNTETPFEAFAPWLDQIDRMPLMTVHPGFGGRSFMGEVVPKIERACDEIDRLGLAVAIEVDGGIDVDTAPLVAAAGATVFVAGSAIFRAPDPLASAAAIRQAAHEGARGGGAEPKGSASAAPSAWAAPSPSAAPSAWAAPSPSAPPSAWAAPSPSASAARSAARTVSPSASQTAQPTREA